MFEIFWRTFLRALSYVSGWVGTGFRLTANRISFGRIVVGGVLGTTFGAFADVIIGSFNAFKTVFQSCYHFDLSSGLVNLGSAFGGTLFTESFSRFFSWICSFFPTAFIKILYIFAFDWVLWAVLSLLLLTLAQYCFRRLLAWGASLIGATVNLL